MLLVQSLNAERWELRIGEPNGRRSKWQSERQRRVLPSRDGSRRIGWMSDQGSLVADERAKSEGHPTADRPSV